VRPSRNTGRDTGDLHTMAPHCCSYCLKLIATKPGIKRHIAQSPACRDHQNWLLERAQFAESNGKDDQPAEEINDNAPLYEWGDEINAVDGPDVPLDIPEGYLVNQSRVDVDPGPPDLCEPPLKRAQVEAEDGDSPPWPASGCFSEQYMGVTAKILGRKQTVFEAQEAAEIARGDSEWAPFRDQDEWELARFMMKNLGQTKINELLKLSSVSE